LPLAAVLSVASASVSFDIRLIVRAAFPFIDEMAYLMPASQPIIEHMSMVLTAAKPTSIADIAAFGLVASCAFAYLLRGRAWDRPDPHHHLWFERPQLKDGATGSSIAATRDIARKMEESVRGSIYYSPS
jgi:hypothetical protein